MRKGDGEDGHDRDQDNADKRKLWLDSILIVADQAGKSDHQQAKCVTLGEPVGGSARQQQQQVGQSEGDR